MRQKRIQPARATPAILSYLKDIEGAVSAEDLYIMMRSQGEVISHSTVRVHLNNLIQKGRVRCFKPNRRRLYFISVA